VLLLQVVANPSPLTTWSSLVVVVEVQDKVAAEVVADSELRRL